jgi:hypothetical protein
MQFVLNGLVFAGLGVVGLDHAGLCDMIFCGTITESNAVAVVIGVGSAQI